METRIKNIMYLCLMLSNGFVSGQTEDHVSVMHRINIVPDNEMAISNPGVADPAGSTGSELYRANYTAVVDLVYGREKLSDIEGDEWAFRVAYDIKDALDVTLFSSSATIQVIENNSIYLDEQRFDVPDGYAKIVITGIFQSDDHWVTESSDFLSIIMNVPEDIRLELRMETSRYDYLAYNATVEDLELDNLDDNNVLIEWTHLPGAESYQIEFAFVTDSLLDGADISDRFDNASRVEVVNNYFILPCTYPIGKLYVRVRPVGRHVRNGITNPELDYHKRTGTWSEDESIDIGFEPDHNWQATTSYAEGGKYKKVIEYFDDGLKKRQTTTNLSTESVVLRAETKYDFEGRPVISVLPAPDLSSPSLGYAENIDDLPATTFEDNAVSHSISYNNGAGLYYDFHNPATLGVHSNYIPDAEGFPYTQIKYLNDATGRIQAQSGVGAIYQLGTGRETKYFYDDPSDTQLRRLFGRNVGLAKYYKRNIVQDPDSQLVVSYVDIAGKTVATALAGKSPLNVQKLKSEKTTPLIENLIENNVVDTISGISRVITTLFNEAPGTIYTFNYGLSGLTISHADTICLSCRYQLFFNIINPCGDSVRSDTIFFSGSDICGDSVFNLSVSPFSDTFNLIGPYTVTKLLRLVPMTIDEWIEVLHDVLPDSAYFADLYLSQIDTTECLQSCEQYCRDKVVMMYPEITGDTLFDSIQVCMIRECLDTLFDEGPTYICDAMLTQMGLQLQKDGCFYDEWTTAGALADLTFIVEDEEVNGIDMFPVLRDQNKIWEDSWADTLAKIHPDYCCYEYCIATVASRRFDFRFPFQYAWEDVVSDVNFLVSLDSFFMPGQPGNGHISDMMHDLETFGSDSHSNIDGCTPLPPAHMSLVDFIECTAGDSSDLFKWDLFQSIYKGLKDKYVKAASCPGAQTEGCTACFTIPKDFEDIESVDDAIAFSNETIDTFCDDVCKGQATMIANMIFSSCTSGSWQELYDTLYNHCIMVCGWQNPLGEFLTEDLGAPSMDAVHAWLAAHSCDVHLFDSLIIVPFDSVYIPLGFPQNAGIDIIDTICINDSINLFVLHDSLYIESLDSLYADSLLGDQVFLLDTGLYYFLGYDSLCLHLSVPPDSILDSVAFKWYEDSLLWAPGTLMGAWPELRFYKPGCYTFGFYTPSMPGACSDYSQVTIYVPGCEEPELVIDSIGECIASAHLVFAPNSAPIDTVIWMVTIDDMPEIPYEEGDTLSNGTSYSFDVTIVYESCCDTVVLRGGFDCPCIICQEQFVDLCDDRFTGFITYDGQTLDIIGQPHCDVAGYSENDDIAEMLEDFLNEMDTCSEVTVSWISLLDTPCTQVPCPCNCLRFIISGSSFLFHYLISSDDLIPFDTSGCDNPVVPLLSDTLKTRSKLPSFASINVYPNPAKKSFFLDFQHDYSLTDDYIVQIADFSGALVYNQLFTSTGKFDKTLIDASAILPGVYKVIVMDSFGHYSTTIVLMR